MDSRRHYLELFRGSPQLADRLFTMGNSLHSDPLRGRIVPEIDKPQVRECFVYSYRVIYEVGDGVVEILTVIHGRRLLDASLK
ncbi:MAG TPA: type II toxin-antitoxin system RelE/ParE family toxin [Cellvibrionaceae bacterium]